MPLGQGRNPCQANVFAFVCDLLLADSNILTRFREFDIRFDVSDVKVHIPTAEEFLPNWTERRFVVLDPSGRWAPAIGVQVHDVITRRKLSNAGSPVFESCQTARDALMLCEARYTVGAILFFSGVERECFNMLARLARWPQRPALLAICSAKHETLLPTMMEAGIDSVLFDVKNDVHIADWCVTVLNTGFEHREGNSSC